MNNTASLGKLPIVKVLKLYWQEIVFVVPIGLLLFSITKSVMLRQTMDQWDIFLVCFFVPLLICLIGQFFWKNQTLALILMPILVITCLVVILMALYGISTTSIKLIMTQSIIMLIVGIIGIVAAVTMPINKRADFS